MFLNGGSAAAWQFGQVLGLLSLFVTTLLAIWVLSLPKGQRRRYVSTWLLFVMTAFTVWMATLYVVDSRPLYETRSRVSESFDVIEAATGLEATNESNYPRIVSVLADRPGPVRSCTGRVPGGGAVRLDGPLTPELQEALAQYLEQDGFTVLRRTNSDGSWGMRAIKSGQSYQFGEILTGRSAGYIASQVDRVCEFEFVE